MATIQVRTSGAGDTVYEPLPADTYYMRIRDADITLSAFKDKDGNDQYQLALTWEISRLTAEQQESEIDDSRWVKQWLSLFYGETKKGVSKLKEFIDTLQAQGLLTEFDPATGEIDSDWFMGIEQRVTLGIKGNYNDVRMIAPLKAKKTAPAHAKNAPQRIEQAPTRRPAPAPPVDVHGIDDEVPL